MRCTFGVLRRRLVLRLVLSLVVLALPVLMTGNVGAADLYVSTAGNDENDCYTSETACATIQAAVDKAPDHSWIHVASGTYSRPVNIELRDDIDIESEPDTLLTGSAGGDPGLVNVIASRSITLRGLQIVGAASAPGEGPAGILAHETSNLLVDNCVIQGFGRGGIAFFSQSFGQIRNSVVRGNYVSGVRVGPSAAAIIGDPYADNAVVVIEDNPNRGVAVSGTVMLDGAVEIRRNGIGISAEGARIWTCCSDSPGRLRVTENHTGIRLLGGYLELRGPAEVRDNAYYGVQLEGASASFQGSPPVLISGNGSPEYIGDTAVFLVRASSLAVGAAEITANQCVGIKVVDNSSVHLRQTDVTNNDGDGLLVDQLSTAWVDERTVISGNGGVDLRCMHGSLASGYSSGIGKMRCDFIKEK